MQTIKRKNIARVEVQKSFCGRCQEVIKNELQKIEDVANVVLYPETATVLFSFLRANDLAAALNTLTALGYPEVGEKISQNSQTNQLICSC